MRRGSSWFIDVTSVTNGLVSMGLFKLKENIPKNNLAGESVNILIDSCIWL